MFQLTHNIKSKHTQRKEMNAEWNELRTKKYIAFEFFSPAAPWINLTLHSKIHCNFLFVSYADVVVVGFFFYLYKWIILYGSNKANKHQSSGPNYVKVYLFHHIKFLLKLACHEIFNIYCLNGKAMHTFNISCI